MIPKKPMINDRPRLKDVYHAYEVGKGFFGGLYSYLTENQIDLPEWLPTIDTAIYLDFVYFASHSGEKITSRFILKFVESDGYITDSNIERISGMWYSVNAANIERLWNLYNVEYNPIENYSMHESIVTEKTGTDTTTFSGKETQKNTGTVDYENDTDANNGLYGFNTSTDSVPSDTMHSESDGKRTDNLTSERTFTNRNNETEYNTTDEMTTDRSGNIGVTTFQRMAQAEIDLWKWNFYESFLFPLVDNLIALKVY